MDRSSGTAAVLRDLLQAKVAYRRKWEQYAKRRRATELSQAAVAQVLALHLWDSGERDDADISLARGLRHRVRRALSGDKLSGETLSWFIDAFEMSPDDEHALWLSFAGGNESGRGIAHTLDSVRPVVRPQLHRTVSLFERYNLDSTGLLISRHTMHVIRAVEADVQCYSVTHEPVMKATEVIAGGRLVLQTYPDGVVNDEIWFEHPLRKNHTASMEYITHYIEDYRPSDVRRGIRARSENVDIAVHFDTSRLPGGINFCAWSQYYGGVAVISEERLIDANGYTHQFLPFAEDTVVGFEWKWE
jgi:hypothetical protein